MYAVSLCDSRTIWQLDSKTVWQYDSGTVGLYGSETVGQWDDISVHGTVRQYGQWDYRILTVELNLAELKRRWSRLGQDKHLVHDTWILTIN